jgi:hypothetical protein
MKEFPNKLNVTNKDNFSTLHYERTKCYLRRELYEHVISHDENDYFSLDQFNKKYNNMEMVQKMIQELIPELESLGWTCKTSYGGTGMFIYSTDKPPPSCWEEEESLS